MRSRTGRGSRRRPCKPGRTAWQQSLPTSAARSSTDEERDSQDRQHRDAQRPSVDACREVPSMLGYEKVGDHWEPKEERGPSDAHAEGGVDSPMPTAGGVDANASKGHLYQLAQQLGINGRSKMSKDELVQALQKANDAATRKARES
ncbi:Rho termination factor N-terminal domain-containing protein [Paenarthrobacter sp. CC6]|nr:Rho termination factor N-terminal domain-containing protein [Paenarthrobacter nicotinovorans]